MLKNLEAKSNQDKEKIKRKKKVTHTNIMFGIKKYKHMKQKPTGWICKNASVGEDRTVVIQGKRI